MPKKFKPVVSGNRFYVQGRIAYEHLMRPYKGETSETPQYSCCVLLDKTDADSINAVKAAVEAAKTKGIAAKWGGKEPYKMQMPLRDGREPHNDGSERGAEFQPCMFFNCKSNRAVPVQNRQKAPIINAAEVYSGMWAIVCCTAFPFDKNGNKGVAIGLEAVLKTSDDEPFGGGLGDRAFDAIQVPDEDVPEF